MCIDMYQKTPTRSWAEHLYWSIPTLNAQIKLPKQKEHCVSYSLVLGYTLPHLSSKHSISGLRYR